MSLKRLHGQAVKTPPFHGGNRGSNPLESFWNFKINIVDDKAEICNFLIIKNLIAEYN